MRSAFGRPTRAELREALVRSGYLLESRVSARLESLKWSVEPNAAYGDPTTGASRELDARAVRAFSLSSRGVDEFHSTLLLECVNNPQSVVFVERRAQAGTSYTKLRFGGQPLVVATRPSPTVTYRQSVGSFLNLVKFHHHVSSTFATQYCSFSLKRDGRDNQWLASHDGAHHQVFQGLCDAVDYYADHGVRLSGFAEFREFVQLYCLQPVLVLQGELLLARPSRRSVRLARAHHVQYRRTLARQLKQRTYVIDVVTEHYLPKFIEIVNREAIRMAGRLKARFPDLVFSLQHPPNGDPEAIG